MDERKAFERRILESPDDEAPRLIYADWLEERGNDALALAMRRTTLEGQKTWGLMTWPDWTEHGRHLLPESLKFIQLDWSAVLSVYVINVTTDGDNIFCSYRIDYRNEAPPRLKSLIAIYGDTIESVSQDDGSINYVNSALNYRVHLSNAALLWAGVSWIKLMHSDHSCVAIPAATPHYGVGLVVNWLRRRFG